MWFYCILSLGSWGTRINPCFFKCAFSGYARLCDSEWNMTTKLFREKGEYAIIERKICGDPQCARHHGRH
jgi:hypothetical protein